MEDSPPRRSVKESPRSCVLENCVCVVAGLLCIVQIMIDKVNRKFDLFSL